jgi:uncharacterized membrane protein YfcA
LGEAQVLTADLGLVSALAIGPALVGMVIGQHIRRSMSEARFRRVFFLGVLALGLYIIAAELMG